LFLELYSKLCRDLDTTSNVTNYLDTVSKVTTNLDVFSKVTADFIYIISRVAADVFSDPSGWGEFTF